MLALCTRGLPSGCFLWIKKREKGGALFLSIVRLLLVCSAVVAAPETREWHQFQFLCLEVVRFHVVLCSLVAPTRDWVSRMRWHMCDLLLWEFLSGGISEDEQKKRHDAYDDDLASYMPQFRTCRTYLDEDAHVGADLIASMDDLVWL